MKFNTFCLSTLTFGAFSLINPFQTIGADGNWADKIPTPVTNPLFFEEAQIRSDVRPIFIHHRLQNTIDGAAPLPGSVPLGGDAQVYAIQLRYAINDRLALIATKDGYIDFNPDATLAQDDGFADIAFGLKYAIINDEENQFLLTPGLKFELPSGNTGVLQGNGSGEWNLFLSAAKGWDDFSLASHFGIRLPNDFDEETSSLHYGLQAAYELHPCFTPFAAVNAFTVLSEGDGLPLEAEGFDLVNFGASAAEGATQVAVGFGFRSRLTDYCDLGFAYEFGVTERDDIFDDRYTVDLVFRF